MKMAKAVNHQNQPSKSYHGSCAALDSCLAMWQISFTDMTYGSKMCKAAILSGAGIILCTQGAIHCAMQSFLEQSKPWASKGRHLKSLDLFYSSSFHPGDHAGATRFLYTCRPDFCQP